MNTLKRLEDVRQRMEKKFGFHCPRDNYVGRSNGGSSKRRNRADGPKRGSTKGGCGGRPTLALKVILLLLREFERRGFQGWKRVVRKRRKMIMRVTGTSVVSRASAAAVVKGKKM